MAEERKGVAETATPEDIRLAIASETTLAEDEAVIERGLGTFVAVGTALTNIRLARKYRETHDSYEAYCLERWGLSQPYALQIEKAAETVLALPEGTPVPANEAQARELAKVPTEARAAVMEEAAEATDGKPTAKDIKQAAEEAAAIKEAASEPSDGDPAGEVVLRHAAEYVITKLDRYQPRPRSIAGLANGYSHPHVAVHDPSAIISQVIDGLGAQVIVDNGEVRPAKEMKHDYEKSNPPGMDWNGEFVKSLHHTGGKPPKEPKGPAASTGKGKQDAAPTVVLNGKPVKRNKLALVWGDVSRAIENLCLVYYTNQRDFTPRAEHTAETAERFREYTDVPEDQVQALRVMSGPQGDYARDVARGALGYMRDIGLIDGDDASGYYPRPTGRDRAVDSLEAAARRANRLDDAVDRLMAKAAEARAEYNRLEAEHAQAERLRDYTAQVVGDAGWLDLVVTDDGEHEVIIGHTDWDAFDAGKADAMLAEQGYARTGEWAADGDDAVADCRKTFHVDQPTTAAELIPGRYRTPLLPLFRTPLLHLEGEGSVRREA